MTTISEEQRSTRRRALGRKLISKASTLTIDLKWVQESPDLPYLTDKERQVLDKQLEVMAKVIKNFNILGERLDK